MIERDDRIGGLAKSYDYEGQIFDIGPKRFHTDDQIVLDFIHEILRDDVREIDRSTKVHFLGRYFDWPLNSKDLIQMPLGVSAKCFVELLQKREIKDKTSFHEYIYQKYGETLYEIFFRPYTHKFLRWDPEDIHSDWASTGINRTIIDKRVKSNSLFDLVKGLMLPSKIDTKFLYPAQGGFGGFYEKLVALCQEQDGFDVIVDDQVAGLTDTGQHLDAVTRNGANLSFGDMIWTGNLNDLCSLASSDHTLPYLNTIFYNIICREEGVGSKKAQWIYVSDGDSLISRITCMKEFAPYTCQDGYYNFVCELTDSQVSPVYSTTLRNIGTGYWMNWFKCHFSRTENTSKTSKSILCAIRTRSTTSDTTRILARPLGSCENFHNVSTCWVGAAPIGTTTATTPYDLQSRWSTSCSIRTPRNSITGRILVEHTHGPRTLRVAEIPAADKHQPAPDKSSICTFSGTRISFA